MEIFEEDKARLQQLVSMAQLGWWEADFNEQVYYCSDFVADVLGLEGDKISFADFGNLICESYRERVLEEFRAFKKMEIYEQVFPIHSKYGLMWVSTKVGESRINEEGHMRVLGMLQCVSRQRMNIQEQTVERLNNLLYRLNGISRSLLDFLHSDDSTQIINKILGDVLKQFHADYVCIFSYDKVKGVRNCTYEMVARGLPHKKDTIQNQPIHYDGWWTKQILSGIPVVLFNPNMLPDDAIEERQIMDKDGIKSIMTVPLSSKDGVWGCISVVVIKDYRNWSNEDYQWLASLANIISICMELRKSEAEARLEKKYLRNIYKNLPAGIELYDKEGYLIDMNEKELEIFGIKSKEDALGINLFENPMLPVDLKRELVNGKPIDFTFKYDFADIRNYYDSSRSGKIDLVSRAAPIFDVHGELMNILVINMDCTDTITAYSKIQEFEEFFTLVGDYAKVGYAHFNALTRDGYAINSWYRNVGEKEGSPLNQIIREHNHFHPEDRRLMLRFFDQVLGREASHLRHDMRILRENGEYTWTRVNVMVKDFRPEEGIIDMVCINYDITELKETEKKLIEAKNKAENLDRLKSAFIANMSHEIRTPLNAIVGFSSLLIDEEDKNERNLYMSIVHENTDLLLQLISDVLDLSKIEAGAFELVKTEVDASLLCTEIVYSMQMKAQERVEVCLDGNLPEYHLLIDKTRVTQVIINFINNALKFTTSGSVCLGYQLVDEHNIKFYVRDTGMGIPDDKLGAIFERFVKLNSFVRGTGLGLPICKSIVEQMGGTIGVESEEGKGSCFWFTIPYKD